MARAVLLAADSAAAWFSRAGAPLAAPDLSAADAYLAALELSGIPVRGATDAAAAEAILRDPAWDTRWWSREESERRRLTELAKKRHGLRGALDALSAATEGQTETSLRSALTAPAIAAGGEALARAAAGALSMALHGMALARLTEAGDSHVFVRKYALFSQGRWPLGVTDGVLHVF